MGAKRTDDRFPFPLTREALMRPPALTTVHVHRTVQQLRSPADLKNKGLGSQRLKTVIQ